MASEHDKVKLASPAAARLISTKVGSGRDEATFMRTDTVSSDQEQVETTGDTPSDRAGSTGPVAAPLRGVFSDGAGIRCKESETAQGDQEFVLYWRTLPWDHAPGALLLGEAGGVARRLDSTLYSPAQHTTGLLVASSQAAWDLVSATLLDSPRRADPGDMNTAKGA